MDDLLEIGSNLPHDVLFCECIIAGKEYMRLEVRERRNEWLRYLYLKLSKCLVAQAHLELTEEERKRQSARTIRGATFQGGVDIVPRLPGRLLYVFLKRFFAYIRYRSGTKVLVVLYEVPTGRLGTCRYLQ